MAGREKPSESDKGELGTWDLRSREPKLCEAHGLPLQEGLAQILYGLIEFDNAYLTDMKDLFPRAMSWVGGGCISSDTDTAQVAFCSLCREAEGVWRQMKRMLSTPLEGI